MEGALPTAVTKITVPKAPWNAVAAATAAESASTNYHRHLAISDQVHAKAAAPRPHYKALPSAAWMRWLVSSPRRRKGAAFPQSKRRSRRSALNSRIVIWTRVRPCAPATPTVLCRPCRELAGTARYFPVSGEKGPPDEENSTRLFLPVGKAKKCY